MPEKKRIPVKVVGKPRKNQEMPEELSLRHMANFLKCVREHKRPNVDVEIGHRATSAVHLGNIAYRTGRKIRWDGDKEEIIDYKEANGFLTRTYRAPYLLPEV